MVGPHGSEATQCGEYGCEKRLFAHLEVAGEARAQHLAAFLLQSSVDEAADGVFHHGAEFGEVGIFRAILLCASPDEPLDIGRFRRFMVLLAEKGVDFRTAFSAHGLGGHEQFFACFLADTSVEDEHDHVGTFLDEVVVDLLVVAEILVVVDGHAHVVAGLCVFNSQVVGEALEGTPFLMELFGAGYKYFDSCHFVGEG